MGETFRFFRFSADHVALRNRLWRWLRPAIGVGLLAILFCRVDWQELERIVRQASLGYVGLALGIALLTVLPRVLRWQTLLVAQGTHEPFLRLLSMYLVSTFFNNFLPSDVGGDSVRMLQLAQLTGRGADAISSVLVERLIGLFAVLLMGVAAVLSNWRLATAGGIGFLVLGAFALFVLAMVLLFNLGRLQKLAADCQVRRSFVALPSPAEANRLPLQGLSVWAERLSVSWPAALFGKLGKLYDSIYAFRHRQRTLLWVLALSLFFRFGQACSLYAQALALHVDMPFIWLLMVISLISVVTSLPLSLNALGIQEGAFVFFFGLAGIAAPQALALALLSRGVRLAVSLLGGVITLLGK